MRLLSLAIVSLAVGFAGCGGDEDPAAISASTAPQDRLRVVATTTQATDIARNVAGERAEVRGLIPANADPHDYDMRPSDIEALTNADVIVRSGGDLDAWLAEAIEAAGSDADVVTLIDHVATREGGHHEEGEHAGEEEAHEEEEIDPHWWHDPRNAVLAVGALRDALARADAGGAGAYRASAARYAERIRELDAAVAACVGRVPGDRRKLVTTHDALGYYAARYGIDVIGAVIPSLSTQGQASAGETAELVATIRRERVRTIFTESSVDSRVERAIARDAGARVGAPLYSDTLGPQGSPGGEYLASIAANTRALVEGFTGEPSRCELPA